MDTQFNKMYIRWERVYMAKQAINMRLNPELLKEAKKVLGEKEATATVEKALTIMINNRKAIEFFRKAAGKSDWKGFDDDSEDT